MNIYFKNLIFFVAIFASQVQGWGCQPLRYIQCFDRPGKQNILIIPVPQYDAKWSSNCVYDVTSAINDCYAFRKFNSSLSGKEPSLTSFENLESTIKENGAKFFIAKEVKNMCNAAITNTGSSVNNHGGVYLRASNKKYEEIRYDDRISCSEFKKQLNKQQKSLNLDYFVKKANQAAQKYHRRILSSRGTLFDFSQYYTSSRK